MNWNDLGQPIGKESIKLAHFIGNYARRNILITCDDWHKKEWCTVKEALADEIKVHPYQIKPLISFIFDNLFHEGS